MEIPVEDPPQFTFSRRFPQWRDMTAPRRRGAFPRLPRFLILGLAPLLFTAAAPAQHTQAYVFAGPSTIPGPTAYTYWHGSYLHAGGGGEGGIGKRFTVGGEAGLLVSTASTDGRNAGVLSVGPAFHFFSRDGRKLDPFVAAGFSLLVSTGAGGMGYFGGGANYWFHRRIGLRLEFRDHVWSPESGEVLHFVGGRFGICFR